MAFTLIAETNSQYANGFEMSLAKQYFDNWFVSIKQQDRIFSKT